MGKKRNNSEREGLGKVTEYEKQRMKILASNEEKMRAAGFSTLANKTIFQSNNAISTNRLAYSHDVFDDEAYSPSDDENAELDHLKKQSDLNNQDPPQSKVYKESRQRIPGKHYLTKFDKPAENIAKMSELQLQQECGEKDNTQDPYYQVIDKPEQNGRLRLHGRGMNKSKLKKCDKNSGYIFPAEFMESVKAALVPNIKEDLAREVTPNVASIILSQIKEANPGINLVIPQLCITSRDELPHEVNGSNGRHSDGTDSFHKTRDAHDEEEMESNDE